MRKEIRVKTLVSSLVLMLALGAVAVAQDASPSPAPSYAPPAPEKEHSWLKQLEGEWETESEMLMGPGQPPAKTKGKETVTMFGPYFVFAHGEQGMGGQTMKSQFTIGYDAAKKTYRGTFVSNCDPTLWTYHAGSVDASGKMLTLEAEGPAMMLTKKKTTQYKETFKIVDADHREFTSSMVDDEGKWITFLTSKYTRK